jgi:hypothetical protein
MESAIGMGLEIRLDDGLSVLRASLQLGARAVGNRLAIQLSEAFGKLTNLEELQVAGEGFTDPFLKQLNGLTRLKYRSRSRVEGDKRTEKNRNPTRAMLVSVTTGWGRPRLRVGGERFSRLHFSAKVSG